MKSLIAPFRNEFWTYVIVTALTLLVWFWAASETRTETSIYPTLVFEAPGTGWNVKPSERTVTVRVEGSNRATQLASTTMPRRLQVPIPPAGEAGALELDLLRELRQQPELRATGVSVVAVDPPYIELQVDELVPITAQVRVELPGIQTEGEPVVDPREVTVNVPRRLRSTIDTLVVDAVVGPAANIAGLEPGISHTKTDVPLRLPDSLRGEAGVSITPATVDVSFTIRSRIQQLTLDAVRVQVSSDPKNLLEYDVEILEADNVLRNVKVSAESDLIRMIEDGTAKVAAIIQLTTRDLEEKIESKRVTYFRVIISEKDRPERGETIHATVGDTDDLPTVRLHIKKRETP